jgi:hypothetical protein
VLRLVRANTYLVTGHGSNSTFRVTPQGVILVNTKLPAAGDYERLAELIHGVTAQPVKFVFNTSARPESNGNNSKFQGAEVVTTERTVTLGGAEARSVRVGDGRSGVQTRLDAGDPERRRAGLPLAEQLFSAVRVV